MKCWTLILFIPCASAAIWDGLKAGFGSNPYSNEFFADLPRTVEEAKAKGWKPDKTGGGCGIVRTAFSGNRYKKEKDPGVMLLFDIRGKIAGIQAGIPKTMTETYPGPQNSRYHMFNEEASMWVVTAYFVEPSRICTRGRTDEEFEWQGTGYMLAFQTGETASSLMRIPMRQTRVNSTTRFVDGKCFFGMGKHYWYNMSEATPCEAMFPAFLLYNDGHLSGFGWAFNPEFNNSQRWEHSGRSLLSAFMKEVPECLGKDGPITTLHIYMTSSPQANLC